MAPAKRAQPIVPVWHRQTVACVGTGPSLTRGDVNYLRGRVNVIAINDAHRLAPWADVLYGCDYKWWHWHGGVPEFRGAKFTQDPRAAEEFGLRWIESKVGEGLSDDPGIIHQGMNSGFQAINLAYLMGATRIILLGYDMQFGPNNEAHYFGDHPDKVRSNYEPWQKFFHEAANQGLVDIINCTRRTALTAFPCNPLSETI